ncbi:MAG: hypothetical protein QM691_01525 [Opitutaceae bacterium]
MSRLKKSSSLAIDTAEKRVAGLESIDPNLTLTPELTLALYKTQLTQARDAVANYNKQLSQADEAANKMKVAERALADRSERMLAGVAAKYGRNSDEYEKAGGTRRAERRKRRDTSSSTPAASK